MTRRRALFTIPAASLAALAVTQTGCGAATVLSDLSLVVSLVETAFSIAAPLFPGLAAPVVTLINGYLNSVSSGIDQTSALIPASGVITPAIAAEIAALWIGVILPVLPSGVPAEIVADLGKIEPAVVAFLQSIGIVPATASAAVVSGSRVHYVSTLKKDVTLSASQLTELGGLWSRARVIEAATGSRLAPATKRQ